MFKDRNANRLCFGQHLADSDLVTKLKLSIGNESVHSVSFCPPEVQSIVQRREAAKEAILGWPPSAKHMVIHRAFYDCDVPHHGTRYSQGPRVSDHFRNIIEVSFLTKHGCYVFEDSFGKSIFYYRASDVQTLIDQNVTRKSKRLVVKLNMCG